MIIYSGMHRKSMEAAHTLSNDILKEKGAFPDDEDSRSSEENELTEQKPKIDEKDEFRSSSIAALRAKAQEHSAKMFGSFEREGSGGEKIYSGGGGGGGGGLQAGHELVHPGLYQGPGETNQQSAVF